MSLFVCDCCDEEVDLINYSMKMATTSNGTEAVYFDKNSKKILLCGNGKNLKPKDNSFKGVPMIQAYSSMSKQDKQKSLLKRSQEHYKKEVKEKKFEMNKKAIEKFQNPD